MDVERLSRVAHHDEALPWKGGVMGLSIIGLPLAVTALLSQETSGFSSLYS
jgi:hypothetical protein